MENGSHRIILLNRLVSRPVTRAREEFKPPTHGALELLQIIEKRRTKKCAIEFLGALDDENEAKRAKNGAGHNFIRLRQCRFEPRTGAPKYAIMLFEFVDQSSRSFPVVNTSSFDGREISGEDEERGATAAHVVVRLPQDGAYDDGSYRCAIEVVAPITRRDIEGFLSRQVRRGEKWEFSVEVPDKRGRLTTKTYQYHPRLSLLADIGRKMTSLTDGRVLTHMTFTKRHERQAVGKPTSVVHEDIYADVELRVSAKQGPEDPAERQTWAEALRDAFKLRGFETHLYYRHINGGTLSGSVHPALDGAADLMMCPKEVLELQNPPKRWTSTIISEVANGMIGLVDNDQLWERSK